jgi:imidazole glycerol-phosphate synthase subunit HisF
MTLARRVIPCLDVRDGRTVKGTRFVNLVDTGDPVEQASEYARQGADEIVYLDISATSEGRSTLVDRVRAVARVLDIPFSVGGGIRSLSEGAAVLEAGADKFTINSAALADPALIEACAMRFGSQCVVLSIDARRATENSPVRRAVSHPESLVWEAYVAGGRKATGRDAVAWAREGVDRGAGEILLTSMDRDGTREGYDLELLRQVACLAVPVIASGGAGRLEHLIEGFEAGADAVLLASLLHFGELSVGQIKSALEERGVVVRQ